MKKITTVSLLAALLLVGAVTMANAESDDDSVSDTGTSPRPTVLEKLRSVIPATKPRIEPAVNPLREKVMEQRRATSTEDCLENSDDCLERKEIRKEVREERAEIREERKTEAKEVRTERREMMVNASSTAAKREILMKTRMETFRIRHTALVRQINLSISNLDQISDRIEDRIDKAEDNGRDMTEAKRLLAISDSKISAAKIAVKALAEYEPTPASTTTSTDVDLVKPRELGAEAIEAVKSARQSLVEVVRAIAHAMGLGKGSNPETTSSTSTATTSSQ